jgi:hypothetical protein
MGVIYHHKSSLRSFDLSIQCLYLLQRPGCVIEDEVLEVLRVIKVGPKDVNGESVFSKLGVALNH